jgi:transcriptional regulator with XRE-family HTH domain
MELTKGGMYLLQLREFRAKRRMELMAFAKQLQISRSTLTRIEAAEREGRKHPVSLEMMEYLTETLSQILDSELTTEDLEGVILALPRPGRLRKKEVLQ